MGDLSLYSIYKTDQTVIGIYLNSEDYVLVNTIEYYSMEFAGMEEERILEDL